MVWGWAHKPHQKKNGLAAIKQAATYFLGFHKENQKSNKETLRNRSLLYNKLDIQCQNTRQQPPTAANPQYLQKKSKRQKLFYAY